MTANHLVRRMSRVRQLGCCVRERAAAKVGGAENRLELGKECVQLLTWISDLLLDRGGEHPVDRKIQRLVRGDDQPSFDPNRSYSVRFDTPAARLSASTPVAVIPHS